MCDSSDVLSRSPEARRIVQLSRDIAEEFIVTLDNQAWVNALFCAIHRFVIGTLVNEIPLEEDMEDDSCSLSYQGPMGLLWPDHRLGPCERWNKLARSTIASDGTRAVFPGHETVISSHGAHILSDVAGTFARRVVEDVDDQEDIAVALLALSSAVAGSLCKLATTWNAAHDRFLVLPPEVREGCFSWLSIWPKCQLCFVSSHWRDTVMSFPALWATFDSRGVAIHYLHLGLDTVISRSGLLPLDFDFTCMRGSDLPRIDECLRAGAHRLRRLTMSFPFVLAESTLILRYAAPRLEELSIAGDYFRGRWGLHHLPFIFEGHAPRLRSVDLTVTEMPRQCPALAHVTSATIRYCSDGLSNVFKVMPVLQCLRLINYPITRRAALPPSHSLRSLEFDGYVWEIPELVNLGYTKVSTFTFSTEWDIERLYEAFSMSCAAPHCMQVSTDGALVFALRLDGGGTLRCVVRDCGKEDFLHLLHDDATMAGIQRLAIVREADVNEQFASFPPLPLRLPGLRTLVVECGPTRFPELVRRRILQHPIHAPALARVELVPGTHLAGYVEPIDAACVLSFLEDDVELNDRAGLEVVVDTARGVRLEGDVELLRQAVPKLIM